MHYDPGMCRVVSIIVISIFIIILRSSVLPSNRREDLEEQRGQTTCPVSGCKTSGTQNQALWLWGLCPPYPPRSTASKRAMPFSGLSLT